MREQSQFIDITGQKFNELTAIQCVDRKKRLWLWKCSCGKMCTARKNDVVLGKKKSCGHLCNKNNISIKTGDKFGEWTVIESLNSRNVLCRCSCGTEKTVSIYDLINGNTKSCGHLTKGLSANGRKDMTGEQIGEWTVGEYLGDGYYRCTCSCGTVKKLKGTYLRTGQSKSCGHNTNKFNDLTGQRFGEWIAVRYLGNHMWECKCSCGNIRTVTSYDLTHSKSTNCGHNKIHSLLGKKFGKLTPIKYKGNYTWESKCDCGNAKNVLAGNLISGETKSCGCLYAERKEYMKEQIIKEVNKFIKENKQLPFAEDIAKILGVHKETIRKYIKEFNLENKFNKSFGSIAERDIYNLCKQYASDTVSRDKKVIAPQELDIYIPSCKLAIEFNGDYWHNADRVGSTYHQDKTIACAKEGIQLISIFEHEWKNEYTKEKIVQIIKSKLINPSKVIYARKTEVREVSEQEAREFEELYHLQGYTAAKINLGLYSNNELISLITFGIPRFNKRYDYEVIRYCTKYDYAIVGGIEKLFSHFVKEYKPKSIITYADISKFTGNVYSKLGFKPIMPNPITKPNYVWVSADGTSILKRYQTQKHKLIRKGLGTKEQTEKEIMQGLGYDQVFDCGNIKLDWFSNTDSSS